jgi:hypothetical protein
MAASYCLTRVKRQRKALVDAKASIYSEQSKIVDVALPSWVLSGFNATLTQVKVTLNYYNNDGTRQCTTNTSKRETQEARVIVRPGQKMLVSKYKTENWMVAVDQIRTFGELWSRVIPENYVPIIMLPLYMPILAVAHGPIDIQENSTVYVAWKDKLDAIRKMMSKRNKQQYLDFLNGEITKVSTSI